MPKALSSRPNIITKGHHPTWMIWGSVSLALHGLALAILILWGPLVRDENFRLIYLQNLNQAPAVGNLALAERPTIKPHRPAEGPTSNHKLAKADKSRTSSSPSLSPSSLPLSAPAITSLNQMAQQSFNHASTLITYPLAARMAGDEGQVNLAIEILPQGLVGHIKVLAGTQASAALIKAAVDGLAKLRIPAWPLQKEKWFFHQVVFKLRGTR